MAFIKNGEFSVHARAFILGGTYRFAQYTKNLKKSHQFFQFMWMEWA